VSYLHKKCLLIAALLAATTTIATASPAVSFGSFDVSGTANPSMRGWQFDVRSEYGIDVTSLGVFDYQANGLSAPHAVGLWASDGTLLASTTVSKGTIAPLDENGLFRLASIAPLHLDMGNGYVIAASYDPTPGDDFQAVYAKDFTVNPAISYGNARYLSQSLPVLTLPGEYSNLGPGIFGASFEFNTSAVPEPSRLMLGAIGLLGLSFISFKRKS
jgi:hypothetical protein